MGNRMCVRAIQLVSDRLCLTDPEWQSKELVGEAEMWKKAGILRSTKRYTTVDCDCDASPADPQMGDIGILASLDPVALDKACTDLVRASDDHGKVHLIERIDSRKGMHTLEYAEQIGLGSQDYELIKLD